MNTTFVGQTELGLWFWKVYFGDRRPSKSGHEATEQLARARANHEAGIAAAVVVDPEKPKPGAFATIRAPTSSSRAGKVEGRSTYTRDFKHDEVRWHRCAHGQKQTSCRECLTWFCSCPGSPGHKCTRAA